MRLTNQEKEMFDKVGFEVRDGHIAHKDDVGNFITLVSICTSLTIIGYLKRKEINW